MVVAAVCLVRPAEPHAQAASPLGGVWSLNRALSELPRDIGFNASWFPAAAGAESGQTSRSGGAGGRGRRASGGSGGGAGGAFPAAPENYLDAQHLQLLTADARNPPARLIIVDNPAAVTMTTELGESRTFHPTGREESIDIQGTPIPVTTRRDGDRLIVLYHVERNRDVQYTYSQSADAHQLIVDVQFLDKGAGDKARRVYEPGVETETRSAAPAAAPPSSSNTPATQPRDTFDERPGAEFRGLKALGILVEEFSSQAVACGLNHDAIESAVSKRLGDAGFTVRKNSDEDTYLYVNVMTTAANGTCTSRYDAFLYTQATANLSYRDRPALVQVSLIHRGGMASSAPATHAAAVARGLEGYVDLFITQIRDANK
jgi:hypothetical protein